MVREMRVVGVGLMLGIFITSSPLLAQITTGTVSGTVRDSQGAVIPGATVVLISETRGTRSAPAVTNENGDYVFPNVTPDTYTVEVTLEGFKTVRRAGIAVSGADRVGIPPLTLEPGGIAETVTVIAESPLVQTQSGERSYAVSAKQIENLPFGRNNFTSLTAFTPGVVQTGASAGGTRLGGAGQNNIMMDGISAMDTGNNGQMLNMNVDAVGEVKILTQGYQAEYGRSSGLQITAVTKSGTNRFRGSLYDIQTNSDWDSNSWVNIANGDPKPKTSTKTLGYTIGGPVGKPGGANKLFFFYSHEYRPVTAAINGGNPIRIRVPTALERGGDFSQTRDNTGAIFNLMKDPLSSQPCTAANTAGCFQDGGVLGKIPQNRLYPIGQAILNRYPLPNVNQLPGQNYNYEVASPTTDNLTQQPSIRVDYQISQKLRATGKYSGQRARKLITPGTIQGFNDMQNPYPFITNYGATVDYQINNSTFLEGTYGFIRNQLAGGGSIGSVGGTPALPGGIFVNESSNRLTSLQGFPLLYPDAGVVDPRYYAFGVLNDLNPVWWDGSKINLPPAFAWGTRIVPTQTATTGTGDLPGPPNQLFPGFLNINRTQDVALSLTKVWSSHTFKSGFYNNHSFKAQNTGAGGVPNLGFQGYVNFGNDTNNALDTGFGFANAAVGVFTQYLQQSKLIEGSMIYNNTEFYVQDNWKVSGRLTLDYGVRFTHQQPQYDQFLQMSNFFANEWRLSAAPLLYVSGCSNGATVCSGNARNAVDPRTGQIVTAPGAANSTALIGTVIPNTGNLTNGIHQAGDGIAKTSYTWPALVAAPRFGMAYDLTGSQTFVLRGGGGLFFDRPDGNTVFSIPGNPPISTAQDLRNGQLQTLGTGLSSVGVPSLITFQYDAGVPSSWQWQGGVQIAMPWATMVDVSYVGNRGFNRLRQFQGGANGAVDLNAVDIGAAYLPQNQDPTLGPSAVPGASAYTTNLLRAFRGFSNINEQQTRYWDEYHGIQVSMNRRYQNGLAFGTNYNLGLSFKGNTGLQLRLQHAADGTILVRPDQEQYEKLLENLALQRHVIKGFAVWDLPKVPSNFGKVGAWLLNDWQISGVLTAGSAFRPGALQANNTTQTNPTGSENGRYDITYTYQQNGTNTNLTGSPDYAARIVYVGDPGSGCSSDQYRQFNTAAVTGPTYSSVGLESGRYLLGGCPDHTVDLAIARNIRFGGNRTFQFRLDVFNVFNAVIYNNRNNNVIYRSPTDLTIVNSQFLPDGSIDPNRRTPRNAGFGAATGAQPLRNLQLQIRLGF
jgi:hypothetical protein